MLIGVRLFGAYIKDEDTSTAEEPTSTSDEIVAHIEILQTEEAEQTISSEDRSRSRLPPVGKMFYWIIM